MKVAIINGSPRKNSQSLKISNYLMEAYKHKSAEVSLISLEGNPFPLWEDGADRNTVAGGKLKSALETLKDCELFVVVSPEYNGMVPSSLINFLQQVGHAELGHKPGLIVSVSAGRGGAYPVLELRNFGYKNARYSMIPDHLIVRDAENVLNQEKAEGPGDEFIRNKIDYTLDVSLEYLKAYRQIRSSGVVDFKNHGNGMS